MIPSIRAGLVGVAVAAPGAAALQSEWNQPHGNAAGTAFVDAAPLKAPPVERWRLKDAEVLAGPAVSQAKLFVVVREGGGEQLLALDPASGAIVAKAALSSAADAFALVAGDGLAAVFTRKSALGFRLAGGELRPDRTIAGAFGGEPTFARGLFLASRGEAGGVQSIDWTSGKLTLFVPKGLGRPGFLDDDSFGEKSGPSLSVLAADEKAGKLLLQRFPIVASGGAPRLGAAQPAGGGPLLVSPQESERTVLVAVEGGEGREWYAWFGNERGGGLLRSSGYRSLEFRHPPAAKGSRLYGFDRNDRLVEWDNLNGAANRLVDKEDLRESARIGAPSIARDVLFLGNWAVELGSRRVLWCLESIEPDGPAIPAGDELLAIRTKDGGLVGFGRDAAGAGGTGPAVGAGRAADPPAPWPPPLPGKAPGIVRSDGLFVAGKVVALENGRFRVEPERGPPQELDADAVALADAGAEVRRPGEEHALYRACWSALSARHAERLVAVFEKLREAKISEDCKRVLEEARRLGLPQARVDDLLASLSGTAAAKGAAATAARKKCAALESEARVDGSDETVAAAKWCARQGAKTAATVLLNRAKEIAPAEPVDPDLLDSWTPSDFPADRLADAPIKTWPEWAEALLPSGAEFAVLDDSMQRRISVTKFAKDSLALRTRNLLLFTKEKDARLLGPLLKRGEATVRALQKILGPSPQALPSRAPLEVRLYVTRSDYLEDRIVGSLPLAWSAGCYSGADGLSRFYSRHESDDEDPLAHTLHEVFAHELTHQYVDRRWVRERPSATSGSYWIVEGFAEFVSDQALEIGRLGEKFDDATVKSLDMTAAAARMEQLLPLEFLLSIDRQAFHKELEGGRFGPVKLKHTLTEVALDKRGVFYAESAAFTFFVMNRCGGEGREALVDWLQKVYSGQAIAQPWKDLGYADVWALKKAFREFLDGI